MPNCGAAGGAVVVIGSVFSSETGGRDYEFEHGGLDPASCLLVISQQGTSKQSDSRDRRQSIAYCTLELLIMVFAETNLWEQYLFTDHPRQPIATRRQR